MLYESKMVPMRGVICSKATIVIFGLVLLTTSTAVLQLEEVTFGERFLSEEELVNDIYPCHDQWHMRKDIPSHSENLPTRRVPGVVFLGKEPASIFRSTREYRLSANSRLSELSLRGSMDTNLNMGRSLRSSSRRNKPRMKSQKMSAKKAMTTAKKTFTRNDNNEPEFHVDYSEARTHPPRNN